MTHVLIADDETHTRISLTFILESIGYLVTGAPDGREALDKILALRESSHPVDLLVLDIEMPGFTGQVSGKAQGSHSMGHRPSPDSWHVIS